MIQLPLRARDVPVAAPPLPPGFDPRSLVNKEIAEGVVVLGPVHWSERHGCWVALANVGGAALGFIEVCVTAEVAP